MATKARPRVTLGLPVYNGERYLATAIEALLAQEFGDFELLIGDNGSTDGTESIARWYAAMDPRITIVGSKENRGAAWNYNRLVHLSTGEYFKWSAHDDVCAPGYVARCVEVLERDESVVLAFPRAADIDDDGMVLHTYPSLAYATENEPGRRAQSMLRNVSPCFESFGVVRRSALLRTSLIGPYTGSDRTLFLELAFLGRFHEVDELLFFHRQHTRRSVHRYFDDRARNAWFDPSRPAARTSPRWRLLREYAASTVHAPAPVSDRVTVLAELGAWGWRNHRVLAKELAVRAGVRSSGRRPPSPNDVWRTTAP